MANKDFTDRLGLAFQTISTYNLPDNNMLGSDSLVPKAVIPEYLYKPPFGYPLNKDIFTIRRLSKTNYVAMIINTICSEMSALDWNINAIQDTNIPDDIIKETKNFFNNPNSNNESFDQFISKVVRDLFELDAGVINKIYNLKGEFVQMYVYDGATFLKNPNYHGIMPEKDAYYQYGWLTGARPVPFNKEEIIYLMLNPRTNTLYGTSPVENLLDTLQVLLYGLESNLEYFGSDNNMPKGVLKILNANERQVSSFKNQWNQQLQSKDSAGNWKRRNYKMPMINSDVQFERISFSNAELELIQQQEWFTKLVLAMFGVTPSELGFTQDSNRATEIIQSNVFKRKTINPLVQLLEYNFNRLVINDLPWIKGKYENQVVFEFERYDAEEEIAKRKVLWNDVKTGLITPNEAREQLGYDSLPDGEALRSPSTQSMFGENGISDTDTTDIKSKKKVQSKALTTDEPLTPKENEVIYSKYEKEVTKVITDLSKKINEVIDSYKKKAIQVKAKDTLIDRIIGLFKLTGLTVIIQNMLNTNYNSGLDDTGTALNRNFLPNISAKDFLENYVFDNIKGLQDDMQNSLRQELQRGVLNNETIAEMSDRVNKVMDVSKVRARMIARTESNRAYNMGQLDAWRQSGEEVYKIWSNDEPESDICKHLTGKKVDINDSFSYKGKSYDSPPAHPNCLSYLRFQRKTKEE